MNSELEDTDSQTFGIWWYWRAEEHNNSLGLGCVEM